MKLNERDVALILSPEGREVMGLSAVNLPETAAFWVKVQDTNDIGLWVRTPREDGDHVLLVRGNTCYLSISRLETQSGRWD